MSGETAISVLNTALGALPSILALVRSSHAHTHPGAAPLTDADVFAALEQAAAQVLAKGAAWKAVHPSVPGT